MREKTKHKRGERSVQFKRFRESITQYGLNKLHNKRFKLWVEGRDNITLLWAITGDKMSQYLLGVYDNKSKMPIQKLVSKELKK